MSDTIQSPARAQWVAVVAVFGALWGAAETTLGALLRSAAIPLHGTIMTGIGVVIMLVARRVLSLQGRHGRGSSLAVGLIAAGLLPLSVSRGIVPAMLGVVAEAACMEIMLYAGRPGRARFALAGLVVALVPPVQKVLWLTAQYGPAAWATFRDILLLKQGGAKLGLAGQATATLVGMVLVLSAAYGLACGFLGWSVARQVLYRLGREAG